MSKKMSIIKLPKEHTGLPCGKIIESETQNSRTSSGQGSNWIRMHKKYCKACRENTDEPLELLNPRNAREALETTHMKFKYIEGVYVLADDYPLLPKPSLGNV